MCEELHSGTGDIDIGTRSGQGDIKVGTHVLTLGLRYLILVIGCVAVDMLCEISGQRHEICSGLPVGVAELIPAFGITSMIQRKI